MRFLHIQNHKDGCEYLVRRRPCEYAMFFSVLKELHGHVVREGHASDGTTDASITLLHLHWDKTYWPAAQITNQTHAAFVVDVCT